MISDSDSDMLDNAINQLVNLGFSCAHYSDSKEETYCLTRNKRDDQSTIEITILNSDPEYFSWVINNSGSGTDPFISTALQDLVDRFTD